MRLKDLATASGCSESLLSRVENGLVVPSIQTLHRLCQALGISAAALLDPEPRAAEALTDFETSWSQNEDVKVERMVPQSTAQQLEGFILSLPAGKICGPFQHIGEELGYILDGELELVVNHETTFIKPGTSFFFNSRQPHWYRARGPLDCRALWITSPPSAYNFSL
jgi:transcriptional regulator with XRE-family HTH domain